MKPGNWLILIVALAAGCAGYSGAGLVPGESMVEDVEASMGDRILWYSKLPYGRESYAARIDPDGTLVSLEQRLTPEHIAKIRPDEATADDVLNILGPPYRRFRFPLKDRESWEYPLWTTPERQTLYVELSPDHVVRAVYRLHDRDTQRVFPFQ